MKRCRHCKEVIQKDAEVCKHCNRHQGRFLNVVSNAAGLITIFLFVISILQYLDSRRERIKAEEAMDTAKKLYNRVDSINTKLKSTVDFINQTAILGIQNSIIQANNPLMGMTTQRLAVKQYEKNLNELIELLIPDSVARRKWNLETEKILRQ